MVMKRGRKNPRRRRASAAAELALLLPVLSYICVVAIDYSRLFYHYTTIAECAYNGAYYASSPTLATASGFSSISQAALADASNLTPTPTVTSTTGTDTSGNAYVQVTVSYTFTTQFNYPGIPTTTSLTRTVRMAKSPS